MSILVLGGAGYIGSHTALELIAPEKALLLQTILQPDTSKLFRKMRNFIRVICMTRRFLIIFLKTNR